MKTEITADDLDMTVQEGLSYQDELELVAKRFGMTKKQTIKSIIHYIYMSGLNLNDLEKAFALFYNDAEFNSLDYNCDGTTTVEDDSEMFNEEPPF